MVINRKKYIESIVGLLGNLNIIFSEFQIVKIFNKLIKFKCDLEFTLEKINNSIKDKNYNFIFKLLNSKINIEKKYNKCKQVLFNFKVHTIKKNWRKINV